MKVRDCLALIQDETVWLDTPDKVRAFQAMVNADKLHHLNEKDHRNLAKLIKWGIVQPKGHSRLPIDEDPQTRY